MTISGRDLIAAAVLGSEWGTAVACGAGDGFIPNEETTKAVPQQIPEDGAGIDFIQSQDVGLETVDVPFVVPMRYQGFELPLGLLMGTAGDPAQQEATAAYLHTLQLASNTAGLFATYAFYKGVSVFEYPSVKISSAEIRGGSDSQILMGSFAGIADTRNINTSSGTNDNTSIADVTVTDPSNRIFFSQGVFRINSQGGAALGAGDVVYPSAFTFSLRRMMERIFTRALTTDEPDETERPEISLRLEFPRYAADTYISALAANSAFKADITFTGATIEDTYTYYLKLQFPNLYLRNVDEPTTNKAAVYGLAMDFDCRGASEEPTGMAITLPVQIDLMTTLTTDPIA